MNALEIAPAEVDRLLETWPVARLATAGADGRPHLVPVVFARAGGVLWSPIDAKPKRGGELVRVANVRREPRAALLLDAYHDDWTRLWWLRVDVEATVVGRDGVAEAGVAALRRKYPQYETTPVLRDPPTLLRLAPLRTTTWCATRDAVRVLRGDGS